MFKKMALFGLLLCLSLEAQQMVNQKPAAPPPPRPYSYGPETTSAFVYGEWLYWLPVTVDPMNWEYKEFLVIVGNIGSPGSSQFSNQQIETLTYDFSSGYRIGGGIRIGKDGMAKNIRPWQIEAIYTDFKASQSSHNRGFLQTSPDGGTTTVSGYLQPLIPTAAGSDKSFDKFTQSHTHASLKFKQIDVDFTWPIWLCSDVILRLKTGPTFAWVENSWRTTWNTNTLTDAYFEATNLKWDWKGGGVTGGSDVYLPIGLGFAFVADANFGFLFGPMKENEAYPTNPDFASNLTLYNLYAERRFLSFQPKISVGAALDYIKTFRKNGAAHLAVGWEFNWWFYLNQFGQINAPDYYNTDGAQEINPQQAFTTTPGGLILQGLRIQAGVEY